RNNKIYLSRDPDHVGQWAGIVLISGSKVNIYNNLICQNQTGIHFRGATGSTANIYNNVFAYNNLTGISVACSVEAAGSEANIYSNIFAYNSYGVSVGHPQAKAYLHYNSFQSDVLDLEGTADVVGSVSIAPNFVNTENYEIINESSFNNLGHPATQFNDKDGSRNDLGIKGGPYAK
ncbi:MAG: right-handed parallel beta-helix repeat-containing protein, partial [Candidatus Margulisbacteria bacterium]|nr:right-handed parallel beta-helix repeat-containing protein [Candidatus Margulisiibacteriota bacterium]